MSKNSIAIIGWWAAGMMVAATIAQNPENKGHIFLFEKNKSLWAKVIISGGWRCNLTTGYTRRQDLTSKYTRGWDFFETSLKKFTPRSVKKRFETNWVPCKTEDDMRVFPISNDGKDVVRMFEDILDIWWVDIKYGEAIRDITKTDDWFFITSSSTSYTVDKVVLTTWGNAFAHTGSSGDGYDFARWLWHTITPLWPSLNSFVTKQDWIHSLSGLSFPEARVHIIDQKTKVSWPVLITHFWLSWPLTFIVASETAFEDIDQNNPIEIGLQPLSDMQYDERNAYLLDAAQHSKKEIITTLVNKLPRRFCEGLLANLEIQQHLPASQITKKQRESLATNLWKWIPLSLIKRRPWDEFVTAWWVDTDEIYPNTLESKICPWLFFAWEILNIDGVTGGYNLQMCWSTGRCVGMEI